MITNAKIVAADYDPQAYHKQDAQRGTPEFVMSRSQLCEFSRCPSRWKDGYERKDSDATNYGSLIDCLVLSSDKYGMKFAVKPALYMDKETAEMKWSPTSKVCREWAAEQKSAGVEPIDQGDEDEAQKAVAKLYADTQIAAYLKSSAKQVYCTAEWHDQSGVVIPLKVLIDLAPDKSNGAYGRTLGDFKTTRDAGLRSWAKSVNQYDYHVQAALFLDVYNAATGEERNDFRHVVQENIAPYQPAKRYLSREFIIGGRNAYRVALNYYSDCLASNTWPDYDHSSNMHVNGWACCEPDVWMMKNWPGALPETKSEISDYRH